MRLLDLTIGTRHFYLPEQTDLAEFERRIEHAARTGGAMIDIPGTHGHATSALITPSMPVFIEPVDVTEDGDHDDADFTSALDFDLTSGFSDWNA
ncbi:MULTISPECIES: hypothetical protein [unclassified Rathayibacter]|uniref:hypothetical protein n=1 Tax=unclassified Rathayibacter TaxID=2609250 RepID=UPI0010458510|nr:MULTISPECIES: hypothetical protein [unclassified Rathayibacter]TCL79540.1 hypothetical protein EDF49_111176 [Rathayibacter sp. PhB192]TCM25191.1 hypothetical protein EDF43_11119 [Rathayibacter sp. PhB179]